MSNRELRDKAAELAVAAVPKVCDCGIEREPERRIIGALALLVCTRCGGRTTERKGGC